MGKIFMEFASSQYPNGVDHKVVYKILDCLPGETYITGVDINSLGTIRIEGLNFNFVDGTEIQGKWIIHSQSNGHITNHTQVFMGVNIIDPPPQQSTSIPIKFTINNSSSAPLHVTLPTYHLSPTKCTISFNGVPVDMGASVTSITGTACQCGKEKHGFAKHSDWCDIKD